MGAGILRTHVRSFLSSAKRIDVRRQRPPPIAEVRQRASFAQQGFAELLHRLLHVPPEANLEGKAFSLNKGCYPGQEVVARMDTYGNVRRKLVGLVLKDATVPPHGAKLFSGDREVGWVSSATRSPQLKTPIALAFPLRDFSAPGTNLTIKVDGMSHDAIVQALPFYSRS